MSYLDAPRLHFRGWFQADVSTINNDVRMYQNEGFRPEWQELPSSLANGSWSPQGTGIFRVLDGAVTGGFLHGKQLALPADDAVIGATVQNADKRAPGKLVDLDPQQQAVSQIWGMQLRLVNSGNETILQGDFRPAAFINLWKRQQQASAPNDQQLAAYYQSVLDGIEWPSASASPLIKALRAATKDNKLSIMFNLWGYARDPKVPRYTMGHIAGTIGPYLHGEPRHFVMGRQMIPQLAQNPTVIPNLVGSVQAKVAADGSSLTADFGNALPVDNANSGLENIGPLVLGVLHTNPTAPVKEIDSTQVTVIGPLPYTDPEWYTQTAGVQTFDLSKNREARQWLPKCPLVVLQPINPLGSSPVDYKVLLQESIGGQYVRADNFVFRVDPGETREIEFYASQFGAPLPNTVIQLSASTNMIGGAGTNIKDFKPPQVPPAPVPDVGVPAGAIGFASSVTTNADGYAKAALTASSAGPGNVRGYIAGQVYEIDYQLAAQPSSYVVNPWNFISVLNYSKKPVPANPTWYADIQPLLMQFGNLYPIMGRYVVNLGKYESVISQISILKLAFSLPIHDPNHMPVTRDLGASDRATILKWLNSAGPDGLPPLGTPPPAPAPLAPSVESAGPAGQTELVGKTVFVEGLLAQGGVK